ncbi:MAG: hypothetical protein IT164_17300 [Bryobacterales bacterium]|nr:hypothetical protein [Bryobacterales bacterium]
MRIKTAFLTVMVVVFLAALIIPFAAAADANNPIPMMRRAEPAVVKAGETVTVYGESLDKSKVADVYLTTLSKQVAVEILEQTEAFIKFRVPAKTEPGKYNPAVLMVKEPMLLVQPVILTVEAAGGVPTGSVPAS